MATFKAVILKDETINYQIDYFDFIREFASTVEVEATKKKYLQTLSSLRKFTGDKLPVSENKLYICIYISNKCLNNLVNNVNLAPNWMLVIICSIAN